MTPTAPRPAHSAPVVELTGAEKIFPNGTRALAPIDLRVEAGELVSFVGPSGCGKSTIFRLVAGLADPSAGAVTVMGAAPVDARRAGGVSYVFQDPTLMPWASVADNVALPLAIRHVPRRERQLEVAAALERVGLADHARDLPHQLSGGMRMRVSIARALISRPRLLLMDEPFGALDEMTRQTLQGELLEIWARDAEMTVLFVTHNVFEAVYLSTRIVVMSASPGRVQDDLPVSEPYPRQDEFRTTGRFGELVGDVSRSLHGRSGQAVTV